MADKTDLTLDPNRRAESSSYNASSMDRYELRPFEPEAEEKIRENQVKEEKELAAIRAQAFGGTTDTGEMELAAIREQVFLSSTPLTREAGEESWNEAPEWTLVFISIFLGVLLAACYLYAGKKKKERERHLADIDDHYEE